MIEIELSDSFFINMFDCSQSGNRKTIYLLFPQTINTSSKTPKKHENNEKKVDI